MNRKLPTYLVVLVLTMLLPGAARAQKVTAEKSWTGVKCTFEMRSGREITLGPGTRIRGVRQVVFMDNERFLASARTGPGVDVFSGDGGYLWSVGRSIVGPIEIERPGPMTKVGYAVHVLDLAAGKSRVLDYDGDLMNEISVDAQNWSGFIPWHDGVLGFRSRPSLKGVLEASVEGRSRPVPTVRADAHSLAVLLDEPRLSLLTGTQDRYFFALPGAAVIYLAYDGRVRRRNRIPDSYFRIPQDPYVSFFAVELDRATGKLSDYLMPVSRVVAVYELPNVLIAVISHDWQQPDHQMSVAIYSKGLRFLDLIRFTVGANERAQRVPVGYRGNSLFFFRSTGTAGGSAAGTRLMEFMISRSTGADRNCPEAQSVLEERTDRLEEGNLQDPGGQ